MKNIKILYLLILIAMYSCETDVTDDISLEGAPPRLVVEGGIERNTETSLVSQTIKLTTTVGFLEETDPTPVLDAVVTVNDGNLDFEFIHQGNGVYTNEAIEATLNTTYTITIIWDGDEYQGTDVLNEVAPFDAVYSVFQEEELFTEEGYFVKFDSTDPAGIENFYYYRIFKNGEFTIVPDPGNRSTLIQNDEFFDGQQRIGLNPHEEVPFELGDLATTQQLGVSEAYYDYLLQLFIQTGNQAPIVGNPPPASIRSNVLNITNPNKRALGFFYAADVEEESIIISE